MNTHTVIPFPNLNFTEEGFHSIADLLKEQPQDLFKEKLKFTFPQIETSDVSNYKNKIVCFKKGDKTEKHFHTRGFVFKIILNPEGWVKYGNYENEEDQDFKFGELALVDQETPYTSIFMEDTMIFLAELSESEAIRN